MDWDKHGSRWPNRDFSRFVQTRACRWHVQDAGRGPVLLLLHGAGASTHSFRALLPDLATDHRVIAIDLPGQGFSRSTSRGRFGLEPMAADIAALLVGEGLVGEGLAPAALIGHSAGAAIALRLALLLPSPPAAIVGINGAMAGFRGLAGVAFPALAKLLALNPLTATLFARTAGSAARVEQLIVGTGSRIDAQGLALYRALVSDPGHVGATLGMMANWNLAPLLADLPRITVPVLFMTGARDRAVPPDTSVTAAATMPRAVVDNIPGFGHLLHEEDPAGTARRIRAFLAQHLDAAPRPR